MDNLLRLPGEVHEQDMARNIVSFRCAGEVWDEHPGGCLGKLRNAAGLLDRHGLRGTTKLEQHQGGSPTGGSGRTAGNTTLSSSSEHSFRKNVVLIQPCAAEQAHLRSHSGPGASDVLCGCLSKPEFRTKYLELLRADRCRLLLKLEDVGARSPSSSWKG